MKFTCFFTFTFTLAMAHPRAKVARTIRMGVESGGSQTNH